MKKRAKNATISRRKSQNFLYEATKFMKIEQKCPKCKFQENSFVDSNFFVNKISQELNAFGVACALTWDFWQIWETTYAWHGKFTIFRSFTSQIRKPMPIQQFFDVCFIFYVFWRHQIPIFLVFKVTKKCILSKNCDFPHVRHSSFQTAKWL